MRLPGLQPKYCLRRKDLYFLHEATMLPLSPAETEQRNPDISRVQPSGSRPVGCLTPPSPPVSLAVASLRPHT
jgi:hypothetical protein